MILRDATLAALTSVIWGLAFVATQFGLESFSAAELTALRFLIAAAPIFLVTRPKIAWSQLILIGLTLFAGQFLLLFLAFKEGMPAARFGDPAEPSLFYGPARGSISARSSEPPAMHRDDRGFGRSDLDRIEHWCRPDADSAR